MVPLATSQGHLDPSLISTRNRKHWFLVAFATSKVVPSRSYLPERVGP